ncbi:MAG: asparagine--tRNA ligase [Candidatus Gracilibacteria bacterium]|jgi:asparaginyl-tRNA synthetase
MAQIVRIKDFKDYVGQEVMVQGWMFNKRGSSKLWFLELRDGSGITQGVIFSKDPANDPLFKKGEQLTMESSVRVTGKVSKHPKLEDTYELQVSDVEIIKLAEDYPIAKKEHGIDFLLENRHLWVRSSKQWATLKIRDQVVWSIRKYMHDKDFVLVDAPIITRTACEDTTELFHVDYFEEDAYLSQSGQLYTEACEYSLGNTYCFGPTFRAEKSKTRRHLTEFWMVEPEMPFMEFKDLMDFEEDFLWNILQDVLKTCKKELAILERDVVFLENIKRPFDRITYDQAVEMLGKSGQSDIKWGDDFGGDDETVLTKQFSGPIMVHRFPQKITSFFQEPDPQDDRLTLNVDLLAPEGYGELIGGGSQRCVNLELLEKRIKDNKINREEYKWYLELAKYGGIPHCGFGMGLERCVAWLCGTHHIRETIPFPRTINRITP